MFWAQSHKLEGFAKRDLGAAVEVGAEVGFGREFERAAIGLGVEVGAVGAGEGEPEATGFFAEALIDGVDHCVAFGRKD